MIVCSYEFGPAKTLVHSGEKNHHPYFFQIRYLNNSPENEIHKVNQWVNGGTGPNLLGWIIQNFSAAHVDRVKKRAAHPTISHMIQVGSPNKNTGPICAAEFLHVYL